MLKYLFADFFKIFESFLCIHNKSVLSNGYVVPSTPSQSNVINCKKYLFSS